MTANAGHPTGVLNGRLLEVLTGWKWMARASRGGWWDRIAKALVGWGYSLWSVGSGAEGDRDAEWRRASAEAAERQGNARS